MEEEIQTPTENVEETVTTEVEQEATPVEQEETTSVENNDGNDEVAEHNRTGYEKRQERKAKYNQVVSENQRLKDEMARMALAQQQAQAPVQPAKQPNQTKVNHGAEPNIDNYTDVNEFVRDMTRYEAKKIAHAQVQEQAYRSQNLSFKQKFDEYAKANPDFVEDLEYSNVPLSPNVEAFIKSSDYGPNVAHILARDEALAGRISNLDPINQVRELTKLEIRAESKPEISKAPAPVASQKTKIPSQSKNINDMSMSEYMAIMNKLT